MLGTRQAFHSPLKLLEMMKWSCRMSWSKSPLARSAVIFISWWAWVHPGVGGGGPTEHTHRWWGRASHGSRPSTMADSSLDWFTHYCLVGSLAWLSVCCSPWFRYEDEGIASCTCFSFDCYLVCLLLILLFLALFCLSVTNYVGSCFCSSLQFRHDISCKGRVELFCFGWVYLSYRVDLLLFLLARLFVTFTSALDTNSNEFSMPRLFICLLVWIVASFFIYLFLTAREKLESFV